MFGSAKHQVDLEMFTIYDSKTSSYDQPLFAVNHHDLIRQILNMFAEPKQQRENRLFLNAEDFSIFRLATFDKKTGRIEVGKLEHIANIHDLKALVRPQSGQVSYADLREAPAVPLASLNQ